MLQDIPVVMSRNTPYVMSRDIAHLLMSRFSYICNAGNHHPGRGSAVRDCPGVTYSAGLLSRAVLYSTVPYCTVQYSTVQCCTVLYCTVLDSVATHVSSDRSAWYYSSCDRSP